MLSDDEMENFEEIPNADWYRDSDTSEDIPDPYDDDKALFQDVNVLPVSLQKDNFQEGLIYRMTLKEKHGVTFLGMVIETMEEAFLFRTFFVRGSKAKTFHEGAEDKKFEYSDVWRLAPRRELCRKINPLDARLGQTLRFDYGHGYVTALIIRSLSLTVKGKVECGKDRGKVQDFTKVEMLDCTELFGSSSVQKLFNLTKNAT